MKCPADLSVCSPWSLLVHTGLRLAIKYVVNVSFSLVQKCHLLIFNTQNHLILHENLKVGKRMYLIKLSHLICIIDVQK